MNNKINERLLKLILWREVLAIPLYTILFNYFIKVFWITIIIDRFINLLIISKDIDINALFDSFFEQYDRKDKRLLKLAKLGIFTIITTPILYILTLINNPKLFVILIILELSDFIVLKLLDNNFKIVFKK